MLSTFKDSRTARPCVKDSYVRNNLVERLSQERYLSPAWWGVVDLLEGVKDSY